MKISAGQGTGGNTSGPNPKRSSLLMPILSVVCIVGIAFTIYRFGGMTSNDKPAIKAPPEHDITTIPVTQDSTIAIIKDVTDTANRIITKDVAVQKEKPLQQQVVVIKPKPTITADTVRAINPVRENNFVKANIPLMADTLKLRGDANKNRASNVSATIKQ